MARVVKKYKNGGVTKTPQQIQEEKDKKAKIKALNLQGSASAEYEDNLEIEMRNRKGMNHPRKGSESTDTSNDRTQVRYEKQGGDTSKIREKAKAMGMTVVQYLEYLDKEKQRPDISSKSDKTRVVRVEIDKKKYRPDIK